MIKEKAAERFRMTGEIFSAAAAPMIEKTREARARAADKVNVLLVYSSIIV